MRRTKFLLHYWINRQYKCQCATCQHHRSASSAPGTPVFGQPRYPWRPSVENYSEMAKFASTPSSTRTTWSERRHRMSVAFILRWSTTISFIQFHIVSRGVNDGRHPVYSFLFSQSESLADVLLSQPQRPHGTERKHFPTRQVFNFSEQGSKFL